MISAVLPPKSWNEAICQIVPMILQRVQVVHAPFPPFVFEYSPLLFPFPLTVQPGRGLLSHVIQPLVFISCFFVVCDLHSNYRGFELAKIERASYLWVSGCSRGCVDSGDCN